MIILDQHVLFMESNVQAWVCGVVSLTLGISFFSLGYHLSGDKQPFHQLFLGKPTPSPQRKKSITRK